jgi:hypothetical protein
MFKGILPSRRIPSGDFSIITNLVDDHAKENQYNPSGQTQLPVTKGHTGTKGFLQMNEKKKKAASKKANDFAPTPVPQTPINPQEFDKLLVSFHHRFLLVNRNSSLVQDDLQIPSSLRPKLYGMDASVKAAMIKSSQTLATTPAIGHSDPITPRANKSFRRAHSTESLSPRHQTLASLAAEHSELSHTGFSAAHVSAHHSPYLASPQRKPSSGHPRGMSFDAPRLFSKSQVNLASSSTLDLTGGGKQGKEKGAVITKNISPTRFCSILTSTSSTQLDVEGLKKLRLLLRNEVASYVSYQCIWTGADDTLDGHRNF